jgi:hypothetical protein
VTLLYLRSHKIAECARRILEVTDHWTRGSHFHHSPRSSRRPHWWRLLASCRYVGTQTWVGCTNFQSWFLHEVCKPLISTPRGPWERIGCSWVCTPWPLLSSNPSG